MTSFTFQKMSKFGGYNEYAYTLLQRQYKGAGNHEPFNTIIEVKINE